MGRVRTTVNFQFLNDNFPKLRGIGLPGGTRSAKSTSALQYIGKYCFENHNQGKEIIIGRDTLANLKKTTLDDFEAVCYGRKGIDPMYPQLRIYDRNNTPRCEIEGNLINFTGLNDDPMRTHGLDSDLVYINEAVSVMEYCFKQLNQRCREGFILDWNPSIPNSWVYNLENREDVEFFHSTFLDNPFLSDALVREVLAYEPTHPDDRHLPIEERRPHPFNIEQGTADMQNWSIYGLGEVYKGKEIIYKDWQEYDTDPEGYDHCFFGLDWGWNAPLAVVKIIINKNNLYVREVVYESEIEDLNALARRLMEEDEIKEGSTYIVSDMNEPRSINTLASLNIPIYAVKKPPRSVVDGIRKVQGFKIHVHQDSHNVINEINSYKWKIDRGTNTILDVPVKENDHAMDAMRYPIWTFL